MSNNQLQEIHTMLEALLKSGNHIHWIGGYVYGRTSQDDPFVILYPASDILKEKAVRVYEHDFRKLPPFIATDNVPGDTENNPNKTQAQKRGIYHVCPLFKICTHDGKDTQMGPEKRFGGVLRVTDKMPTPETAEKKRPRPGLFQVGDEVLVKGKTDERPGTIKGINGDDLFTVAVAGKQLLLGADKLTLVAMA